MTIKNFLSGVIEDTFDDYLTNERWAEEGPSRDLRIQSLVDKAHAEFENKVGIKLDNKQTYIDSGANGSVYKLDATRVIKFTSSSYELDGAKRILAKRKKRHKHIYEVLALGKLKSVHENFIVMPLYKEIPRRKAALFCDVMTDKTVMYMDDDDFEMLEKHALPAAKELDELGLKHDDLHEGNIMQDNKGNIVMIDIGDW